MEVTLRIQAKPDAGTFARLSLAGGPHAKRMTSTFLCPTFRTNNPIRPSRRFVVRKPTHTAQRNVAREVPS